MPATAPLNPGEAVQLSLISPCEAGSRRRRATQGEFGGSMRVLVVEDDVRLAEVLFAGLTAEGFDVDVVHDGFDGYWQAREGAHDVVVLDVLLPSVSGYAVAQRLRGEEIWTPILMLTAK